MAWATAMLSFADGSEDLLSRQTFSGNFLNRFEIIPMDGLGFAPTSQLTLQMFDRSAPIRGFPNPASSVALDGEALESPGPIHITTSDVRIAELASASHFSPFEWAPATGPLFQRSYGDVVSWIALWQTRA